MGRFERKARRGFTASVAVLCLGMIALNLPASAASQVVVRTIVIGTSEKLPKGSILFDSDGGEMYSKPKFRPDSVYYYIDNKNVGKATRTIYGYLFAWDSRKAVNGKHSVFAQARKGSSSYNSSAVSFTVTTGVKATSQPTTTTTKKTTPTTKKVVSGTSAGGTWGDHMGISMNWWEDSLAANIKNTDMAKSLGVKWLRVGYEMGWGSNPQMQTLIDDAHSKGMKILWVCQKSPHQYGLSDVNSFAAYCASAVDMHVDAIEIGNEWNHDVFWKGVNGDYSLQAAITDAATNAIRAKSASIPVMNAGFSPESSPNLPQEAIGKLLDKSTAFKQKGTFIAHHGYAYNCDDATACNYPDRRDWNAFLATQDVYNAAKARGFAKPVWLTEMGGPSGKGTNLYTHQAFTPQSQAELYKEYIAGITFMNATGTPVDVTFWHTIQDGQSSTNDTETTFGLFDANWKIKPAGQVVKDQSSKPW